MCNVAYENKYSVLMSVYYKETAGNLYTAINSIWNQSIPTNDFVLVCDGPLTPELDSIIEQCNRPELNIIYLKKNGGLGNALNIGIKHCRNELVARMDSDDISRPDRCEKQLKAFNNHPEASIISGIVEEFSTSPDTIDARRVPPESQEEIIAFAKKRNPFNHPCVMYKKSAVEAAGGYQDFYLLEDYYLWIRMLQNGAIGYNLQEPLLWMRAGSEMYKRRAGWKYLKSQKALFDYMANHKFISKKQCLQNIFVRSVSSLLPNVFREYLFGKILRKH